jgi:thymidylate kinase
MQKYIIFEGLDRCGKDTQVGLVQKSFSEETFHVFHYSKIPLETPEQNREYSERMYTDMFEMMKENKGSRRNFIFNRSHLGESVYAPLYRNYLGDYVFKIESEYVEDLNKNLYLIVLTNDPEILLSREDGDSLSKSVEDILKEKQMFERTYYESKIQNKIMINCGVDSPIEIAKIISEFILETENENIPK